MPWQPTQFDGIEMKILYQERKTFGRTEQGIIKCDVGNDGALTNCRRMAVKLED